MNLPVQLNEELHMTTLIRFFITFCILNYLPVVNADTQQDGDVVVIKTPEELISKQRLPYFHGISSSSAGSKVLSMNMVMIPPGAQAEAHYHDGYESAIYLIQGTVETRYGTNLAKSIINEAGDFIFIPPNVPHQPRNLSSTETAIAIVTRNDPNEQESVVPYEVPMNTGP